jgi:hypothetical protein
MHQAWCSLPQCLSFMLRPHYATADGTWYQLPFFRKHIASTSNTTVGLPTATLASGNILDERCSSCCEQTEL